MAIYIPCTSDKLKEGTNEVIPKALVVFEPLVPSEFVATKGKPSVPKVKSANAVTT
jgi:hypothetical protein